MKMQVTARASPRFHLKILEYPKILTVITSLKPWATIFCLCVCVFFVYFIIFNFRFEDLQHVKVT